MFFVKLWIRRPDIDFSGVCFGLKSSVDFPVSTSYSTRSKSGSWAIAKILLSLMGQNPFRTKDDHIYLHHMYQEEVAQTLNPSSSSLLAEHEKFEFGEVPNISRYMKLPSR